MKHIAGPLEGSYWLTDRICVGGFPGHAIESEEIDRINALFGVGIRCFLDLTVPREKRLTGGLQIPYLQALVYSERRAGLVVRYRDFEIEHGAVPRMRTCRAIMVELEQMLSKKGRVYLHSRDGIGRAGMIACIWLLRNKLATKVNVFDTLRKLRGDAEVVSPNVGDQRKFVQRWNG